VGSIPTRSTKEKEKKMTEQERIDLIIEKRSYQEVIKQFSSGCDARMEVGLNSFLQDIENKIKEIDRKLDEI
jgi:hypothetical protein